MILRKMNSVLLFLIISVVTSCNNSETEEQNIPETFSEKIENTDAYRIIGDNHFVDGYEVLTNDSLVNVVIEIPTGSIEKWEVEKATGHLALETRNGYLRKVNYLGYPGNYGMVPKTLSPYEDGGDGDPLDILILGEPLERGAIVPTKLIGVLKLLDRGEQDDKLIAVAEGSPFFEVDDIEDLDERFKGVTAIIKTWFNSYKGGEKIEIQGFGDKKEANNILDAAILGYTDARK